MRWCGAAGALLLAAATSTLVESTLVTITEYEGTCSATHTSPRHSITKVQSTTTVYPMPWPDEGPNYGTPFVLQVEPCRSNGTSQRERRVPAQPIWLMLNGDTTTDGSKAARYTIQDGTLKALNHKGYVSAEKGSPIPDFFGVA